MRRPKDRVHATLGWSAAVVVACTTPSVSARADESETGQQLAQSLFDEARALMAEGRFAEACPKLAESQRIDPGGGTRLNLALCREKEGKLASAWAEFNAAYSESLRDGRRDREQIARDHLASLEPRLAHVVLRVAREGDLGGLELSLDGVPVRRPAWGTPIAVDPGPHRVLATAPGRQPWTLDVRVGASGETSTVDVPTLPSLRIAIAPVVTTRPHPFVVPLVILAGTSLATSLVTGALALEARAVVRDECIAPRQYCVTSAGIDASGRARTLAWASTVTLGVAAAAAVTALVLPRRKSDPSMLLGGFVAPGGGGLEVRGAL